MSRGSETFDEDAYCFVDGVLMEHCRRICVVVEDFGEQSALTLVRCVYPRLRYLACEDNASQQKSSISSVGVGPH